MRAVRDSAEHASGQMCICFLNPWRLGIGIDVEAPEDMIVDIGGGSTEIAFYFLRVLTPNNSIRIAGDDLTADIQEC